MRMPAAIAITFARLFSPRGSEAPTAGLAAAGRALDNNQFRLAAEEFHAVAAQDAVPAAVRAAAWRGEAVARLARGEPAACVEVLERAVMTDPAFPGNAGILQVVAGTVRSDGRPARWTERLSRLSKLVAGHPVLRTGAIQLQMLNLRMLGRFDRADALLTRLHPIQDFLVTGPFDDAGGSGIDETYPPEERCDATATYRDCRGRTIGWFRTPPPMHGAVDFDVLFENELNAIGYAVTHIEVCTPLAAIAHLAGSGAARLWVNGQLVLDEHVVREAPDELYAIPVWLAKGWNRVMVKMGAEREKLRFSLRFTDRDGTPLVLETNADTPAGFAEMASPPGCCPDGSTTAADTPAGQATLPLGLERFPAPRSGAEGWLRRWAAAVPEAPLQDAVLFIQFLLRRGFLDEAEHALTHAITRFPAAALLEELRASIHDARDSGESRSIRRRACAAAPELVVGRPRMLMDRLGTSDEDGAKDELEVAVKICGSDPLMLAAHGWFLIKRGDIGGGLDAFRRARDTMPGHAAVLDMHMDALKQVDRRGVWEKTLLAALRVRPDMWTYAREAAAVAHSQGRYDHAIRHLKHALRAGARPDAVCSQLATVHEAAGRTDAAVAALEDGLRWSPMSKKLTNDLSQLLLKLERREDALPVLRRHLQLNPGASETRDLIRKLEGGRALQELFQREDVTTLAKANLNWVGADAPAVCLLDAVEIVCHPDGARERRHHVITKILTDAGVERYRKAPVRDVEVARSIKPDGREIDAEQGFMEIAFKDLQPGDLTEFRYVRWDAPRPGLAAYFWAEHFFQIEIPVLLSRLSVLRPGGWSSRTVLHNASPATSSVRHGEWCLDTWEARRVPAAATENRMPPAHERCAWLDVSNVPSWEAIARWYDSVSRGRTRSTRAIRALAQQLEAGAGDDSTRICRVALHVKQNIRYEDGEFVASGFIPRPADTVLKEKFGDCKDQAGLIVSLLHEMGIEASFALVNSRDETTVSFLPSPRFTHVIVQARTREGTIYWIDSTASDLAFPNVPVALEGAKALVVNPIAPAWVTIGEDPPAANGSDARLEASINGGGDLHIEGECTFIGEDAANLRTALRRAPECKDEVSMDLLARSHPGSAASDVVFDVGRDIDDPVRLSFQLKKPGAAAFASDLMIIKLPWTFLPVPHELVSLERRDLPLMLGNWKGRYREGVCLRVPEGYMPNAEPKPVHLHCSVGRFSLHGQWSGRDTLVVEKVLELDTVRVEPGDYAEFRQFLNQAWRAEQEHVVLRRNAIVGRS